VDSNRLKQCFETLYHHPWKLEHQTIPKAIWQQQHCTGLSISLSVAGCIAKVAV